MLSTATPTGSAGDIGRVRPSVVCCPVSSGAKQPCGFALLQVVLFNHVSWVDSLVMMRMFAPSGVAKARAAVPCIAARRRTTGPISGSACVWHCQRLRALSCRSHGFSTHHDACPLPTLMAFDRWGFRMPLLHRL